MGGISLENYRQRIGTFQPKVGVIKSKLKRNSSQISNPTTYSSSFLFRIILLSALVSSSTSTPSKYSTQSIQINSSWTVSNTVQGNFFKHSDLSNFYSKYTNGNRKEHGLKIAHFNMGGGHLENKIDELENVIAGLHPHLIGVSETSFHKHHDAENVQIQGYKFITSNTLNNNNLQVSRISVFVHESVIWKLRTDLMSQEFSSIWLEVGLPRKRKILVCQLYRDWGYLNQPDKSSRSIENQLSRWLGFLEQWNTALASNMETHVTGDCNLDFLKWTRTDLPTNSHTAKLKPLISALFEKILSQGVSQCVRVATRSWRGVEDSGLDHYYCNRPDKISDIQTQYQAGSDHRLIFTTRYAKAIKRNVRYTTKRVFKNFVPELFVEAVRSLSWWDIYQCEDVDEAVTRLTEKLTTILDVMAPIKTIQTRTKYAPWLSEATKTLMKERDEAHEKATKSGNDENWKSFKAKRNRVSSRLKNEKKNWQKFQMEKCEDEPSTRWKHVKGLA